MLTAKQLKKARKLYKKNPGLPGSQYLNADGSLCAVAAGLVALSGKPRPKGVAITGGLFHYLGGFLAHAQQVTLVRMQLQDAALGLGYTDSIDDIGGFDRDRALLVFDQAIVVAKAKEL